MLKFKYDYSKVMLHFLYCYFEMLLPKLNDLKNH